MTSNQVQLLMRAAESGLTKRDARQYARSVRKHAQRQLRKAEGRK